MPHRSRHAWGRCRSRTSWATPGARGATARARTPEARLDLEILRASLDGYREGSRARARRRDAPRARPRRRVGQPRARGALRGRRAPRDLLRLGRAPLPRPRRAQPRCARAASGRCTAPSSRRARRAAFGLRPPGCPPRPTRVGVVLRRPGASGSVGALLPGGGPPGGRAPRHRRAGTGVAGNGRCGRLGCGRRPSRAWPGVGPSVAGTTGAAGAQAGGAGRPNVAGANGADAGTPDVVGPEPKGRKERRAVSGDGSLSRRRGGVRRRLLRRTSRATPSGRCRRDGRTPEAATATGA